MRTLRGSLLTLALSSAAFASVSPTPLAAQTTQIDSLTRVLDSPDLDARARAVASLRAFAPSLIPAGTRSKLYALLDAAGQTLQRNTSDRDDSALGEYQMQLAKLVVSFRDPASVHALAFGGVEISAAIEDFLASQGSAAVPALDQSAAFDSFRRGSVLSTFGRMLRDYPSALTDDLRQRLRADILSSINADTVDFIFSAQRAHLIEAIPLLQAIQALGSNTDIVPAALTELLALRSAASPATLVANLQDAHDAICRNAQLARNGACQSTDSHLKNVQRGLDAGQPAQARDALTEFINRVNEAAAQGVFTRNEATILAGSAAYVMTRL